MFRDGSRFKLKKTIEKKKIKFRSEISNISKNVRIIFLHNEKKLGQQERVSSRIFST